MLLRADSGVLYPSGVWGPPLSVSPKFQDFSSLVLLPPPPSQGDLEALDCDGTGDEMQRPSLQALKSNKKIFKTEPS